MPETVCSRTERRGNWTDLRDLKVIMRKRKSKVYHLKAIETGTRQSEF